MTGRTRIALPKSILARAVQLLVLLASGTCPGCFTCAVLDGGVPGNVSASPPSGDGAGGGGWSGVAEVGFVLCLPCIVPLVIVPAAFAMDVVAFPIQISFGYYPYGSRGKVSSHSSDDKPTLPPFGTDTDLEERR